MRIRIKNDCSVGVLEIPAGEYLVAARPDEQVIALISGGRDILVPAKKRPLKPGQKIRVTDVQFYAAGGADWTLSVKVPNRGEYVSFLTMGKSKKKD